MFDRQSVNGASSSYRNSFAILINAIIRAGKSLRESMVGMEGVSNAQCATVGTDSLSFDAVDASWTYVCIVARTAFKILVERVIRTRT